MLREKRVVPFRQAIPKSGPDNGLARQKDRFLDWTLAIGLSEQTEALRRAALDRFVSWCLTAGAEEASQITRELLEAYQLHLFNCRKTDGERLALTTQACRLNPVRAFCRWLAREGLLTVDPARDLETPRLPRRLPRWIPSVRDVRRILAQPDTTTLSGLRDRTILEMLYASAIRRMELVKLQVFDVDLEGGLVAVRNGKGRRDRVVPMGTRTARLVASYLSRARPVLIEPFRTSTLFVTDFGEPFVKNRLGDLVRRYIKGAGIKAPGACHLFRHACATHMLENGADIRFIQAMLGHADLSTTQIYTHVSTTKLTEVHAATHPANRDNF
jgi:integrase/recombinase XerD